MHFIYLSSYDCLSVEEQSILITKFDPFIMKILEPVDFFLEEDVVVFYLSYFLSWKC